MGKVIIGKDADILISILACMCTSTHVYACMQQIIKSKKLSNKNK